MLVWKQILWLRERIKEQKAWIERCGGDLAGYIANYGDPGVPPLDANGTPQTFKLTTEQQKLFPEWYLMPVPGLPGTYFKRHSGDGGTAIYEADYNRLVIWQRQLDDLEINCRGAVDVANRMERKVKIK